MKKKRPNFFPLQRISATRIKYRSGQYQSTNYLFRRQKLLKSEARHLKATVFCEFIYCSSLLPVTFCSTSCRHRILLQPDHEFLIISNQKNSFKAHFLYKSYITFTRKYNLLSTMRKSH